MTEPWLSGPVPGVIPELMPAAHMLLNAKSDLSQLPRLSAEMLQATPGGAASIGFHLAHIAGAIDRLLTYSEGKFLSEAQRAASGAEKNAGERGVDDLLDSANRAIEYALDALKQASRQTLFEERKVGRAQLPSTTIGLLYHAAEHTVRHAGQVLTTAKILQGM
jgi:uncharacterized damage-inducible protein DinB